MTSAISITGAVVGVLALAVPVVHFVVETLFRFAGF